MLLASLLVLSLGASPGGGVVLTQRSGVNRNLALSRAELVRAELGSARLGPAEELTSCNGKKPCLVKAARDRGWSVLVTVEAAAVLDDAILNVSLLSIDDDGRVFSTANLKAPAAKLEAELSSALKPMKAALEGLLGTRPVEPEPVLKPAPKPDPVVQVEPPPPMPPLLETQPVVTQTPERPAARWVPFASALAITVAGGICFGVSAAQAERLRSGSPGESEIDSLVGSGKFLQTFGVAALIGGGALTLGSLALALLWPTPSVVKPSVSLLPGGGTFGLVGVLP
jgi:hypothetical protein